MRWPRGLSLLAASSLCGARLDQRLETAGDRFRNLHDDAPLAFHADKSVLSKCVELQRHETTSPGNCLSLIPFFRVIILPWLIWGILIGLRQSSLQLHLPEAKQCMTPRNIRVRVLVLLTGLLAHRCSTQVKNVCPQPKTLIHA